MLGNTLFLSTSRIYGAAISAAQGLLIARALGPHLFGVFNLIYLIGWYVGMVHFGARDVAYREIPYFRGRHDPAQEKLVRDVTVTGEMVWRAISSILLALAAFCVRDPLLRNGLLLWAGYLFVARLSELYNLLTIIEHDFALVSWVNALKLTVTFGFIAATIHWLGIYSALVGPVLGSALAIHLFARRYPLAFVFRWHKPEFLRALKSGFPLALLTFVYWLCANSDRTVVAFSLDRASLGYYGIAVFLTQFLMQLPGDFITVLQPRLYRELGKENELAGARLRILSLNLFFASLLAVPYTILYSPGINRQGACVIVWSCCALFTAAAALGFLRLGWGLNGVAVASVLGLAAAAVWLSCLAYRYYSGWLQQDWRFYVELVVPLAYMALILAAVGYETRAWSMSWVTAAARSGLLLLLYLPYLVYMNRRTQVFAQFAKGT